MSESLFEWIAQNNEVLKEFKHHSLRVMYLSTLLGKKLNCYDEDLKIAALFHDIGKVGLSSDILLKPGKLTPLERIIVESHCHIGNTIVRKLIGNNRAARFIRDHHENWDGTGYPRNLTGKEISLQGRIIRVCDSFDAMTYEIRSYKTKRMTNYEAIEELKNCSWTQFDGNVVNEFISLIKDIDLHNNWYHEYDEYIMENIFKNIIALENSY